MKLNNIIKFFMTEKKMIKLLIFQNKLNININSDLIFPIFCHIIYLFFLYLYIIAKYII